MSTRPRISVVIPAYREAAYIDRCLRSLLEGSWPLDALEILIAEGGSEDGTRERVAAWSARFPCIRLLDNPERYVPQGINRGIRAASGEIVVFMGAHAEADPHWFERVWEDLQAHPEVVAVGGAWEICGEGPVGEALALAQSSRIGVGSNSYRNGRAPGYADTVVYGAYRREVFERHGLLDEEMIRDQDDEFNIRLVAAGEKLWYDPRIRTRYHARSSFGRLWRQYYQYGFWKVRVRQKVGRLGSPRQLAPMAFVAGGAAALALAPLGGAPAAAAALYWGLYAAAVAAGALTAARRKPWLAPLVAAGIVTLHLAYGLGFWEGLLHFGLLGHGRRLPSGRDARHVASSR